MKLLISLLIVYIICMAFGDKIKANTKIWLICIFLIGLASMFLPASAPIWLQQIVTGYITRGTLATSMFIWVMYARILPNGSKPMITMMSLRAPLAIGASLLILVHNAFYIIFYLKSLLRGNTMSTFELLAGLCTIAMWILLLPLTITSFSKVRRKINPKRWKKLQRFSYLFYGLIYLHVLLLFVRQLIAGQNQYALELSIYTAVFGFYLVERVALYLRKNNKLKFRSYLIRFGEIVLSLICSSIFFFPYINENVSTSQASNNSDGLTENETSEPIDEDFIYKDGVYTGSAMGLNDFITVSVEIENGKIQQVSVISASEDDPYYTWALQEIPSAIVESNSYDVDSVSGATVTSKGIINAVKNALSNAKE